jgi:hypothetical protein
MQKDSTQYMGTKMLEHQDTFSFFCFNVPVSEVKDNDSFPTMTLIYMLSFFSAALLFD